MIESQPSHPVRIIINEENGIMTVNFIPKSTTGNKRWRCVDGRPDPDSEQGPQALGGILHSIVLATIFNDYDLNEKRVAADIFTLQESGVKTGVHRGPNSNKIDSECGFADKLRDIIKTAVENRELITNRLIQVYVANRSIFKDLKLANFGELVDVAYEKISAFDPAKIKIKGNPLVSQIESLGAKTEVVQGHHQEELAFVNLKKDTTLDTIELNRKGQQAFNLDLLPTCDCARLLGIPQDFSIPASLILYIATEIVLVENKGKPALPVEIHS